MPGDTPTEGVDTARSSSTESATGSFLSERQRTNRDISHARVHAVENGGAQPNPKPKISGRLFEPYDPIGKMRFDHYKDLVITLFKLNGVTTEDDQRMYIMGCIGTEAYSEMRNALHGRDMTQVAVSEMWKVLEDRYMPKKLVVAERDKFLTLRQKPGQSLTDFMSELMDAALGCDFDKITDANKAREMMLTQAFLRGISSEQIRARILQTEQLDCKEVLKLARVYEQADHEGHKMGQTNTGTTVGRVQTGFKGGKSKHKSHKSHKSRRGSRHEGGSCPHCGGKGHKPENCYFREATCHTCKQKGHIAKVCRRSNQRSRHSRKPPSEDQYVNQVSVTNLRTGNKSSYYSQCHTVLADVEPARYVTFVINGKRIRFELDTGAGITLLPREEWERLGKPKLVKSSMDLTTYQGHQLETLGSFVANAEFDNVKAQTNIHVAAFGSALCGRTAIRDLKIDLKKWYPLTVDTIGAVRNPPKTLTEVLNSHEKVFDEKSACCTEEVHLHFKEKARPIFHRPRNVPFALKPKVEQEIERLEANGTLKSVETSDWATPIVVVPKPNGQIRMCGDFKVTVNPALDVTQHCIPKTEELFHKLNGGTKFSKLDLKDAYLQCPLDEESRKCCVINTHKGLFQYQRLAFGISSAPAIFQRLMEKILNGIEGVVVYLDDITVTGKTDEEHLERLKLVLERLVKYGLRLKREKCEFLKPSIRLLGRIVDSNGVHTDPKKVEAILQMPDPKSLKELEVFLGMVQYYAKYIPHLATLAAPLNSLKSKGARWKWGNEEKKATRLIREALASAEVLAHFNPEIEVVLATDASEYGLGAVIFHRYSDKTERVIAYASRSLTKAERNYAQIEKEALGIMFGIEKFNEYLYGRKFTLQTDHQPLQKIYGPKGDLPVVAAKRLHRWGLKLSMYQFDIEYVPTEKFGNADGLSRLPDPYEKPSAETLEEQVFVNAVEEIAFKNMPLTVELVRKAQETDRALSTIKPFIKQGWPEEYSQTPLLPYYRRQEKFTVYQEVIMNGHQVVIPENLRPIVLEMLHDSHIGNTRMRSIADRHFWWPSMREDIEITAKRCKICHEDGPEVTKTPLHVWEEPARPWQRIHIDFAGPEKGFMWLIVVDAKSKWPEIRKMSTTTATATIVKMSEIFATHGICEQLVSDNGPQFSSEEFKEFCRSLDIKHYQSAPYHPQSNGLAERFVRTFKTSLRKILRTQKNLDLAVTKFLLTNRTTEHPATGKTPAAMIMGRELRTQYSLLKPLPKPKPKPLNAYQQRMKKNYNKRVTIREFSDGDAVWVRNYALRDIGGRKWVAGIVLEQISSNLYFIETEKGIWKRSTNQMKRRFPENAAERTEKLDNQYLDQQNSDEGKLWEVTLRNQQNERDGQRWEEPDGGHRVQEQDVPQNPRPGPAGNLEPIVPNNPPSGHSPPLAQRRNRRDIRPPERSGRLVDPSSVRLPARQWDYYRRDPQNPENLVPVSTGQGRQLFRRNQPNNPNENGANQIVLNGPPFTKQQSSEQSHIDTNIDQQTSNKNGNSLENIRSRFSIEKGTVVCDDRICIELSSAEKGIKVSNFSTEASVGIRPLPSHRQRSSPSSTAMDTAAISELIATAVSRAVKAASTGSAGDASQNVKKPEASGTETRQLTWQQKRAIERQTKTASEAAMNVVNRELEPLKKDIAAVRAQVTKITEYLQENKIKKGMFLPEGSLDSKAEKALVCKAENSISELKRKARKLADESTGTSSSGQETSPKKIKRDASSNEPQKTQDDDSNDE